MSDGTEVFGIPLEEWATMEWHARFAVVLDVLEDVEDERDRLQSWITRIATWKLPRNAGYFARVFKLEAKAILEGKDVPSTLPDRPYTSRPHVKFYDCGLPHEKGPTNESDQTP